jgi:hypothetical protein
MVSGSEIDDTAFISNLLSSFLLTLFALGDFVHHRHWSLGS